VCESNNSTYGACLVRAGTLYCWGDDTCTTHGQLGFPGIDAGGGVVGPVAVSTAKPASQISEIGISAFATCALFGQTPYCWGDNYADGLGVSQSTPGPTEYLVAGIPPTGLGHLATSKATTCAIASDPDAGDAGNTSNVWCWGLNYSGELGRPYDGANLAYGLAHPVTGDWDGGPLGVINDARQIAGGDRHFCALTSASEVRCWGDTSSLECGPTLGASKCADTTSTCSAQPITVPFPADDAGQAEIPSAVAVGADHSCVLTRSGRVYCWGSNEKGQLGAQGTLGQCTSTAYPCTGAPLQVSGFPSFAGPLKKLVAGGNVTCALDDSGHAFCWGDPSYGQLAAPPGGDGSKPLELVQQGGAPYPFDDLAIGGFASCGRTGGTVYCWGQGTGGSSPADAVSISF
jgi:hypothetical protein